MKVRFKISFKNLFIIISGVSLSAMLIHQVLSPYQNIWRMI